MKIITRRELELINRKNLRYPLSMAEKDYLIALILKIIYESPLGRKLIFKGGTAIHHTYLTQTRFSEDIDFTAVERITLEEINSIFNSFDFLELKEAHTSNATIKISRLKYSGPLGQPNSLKIEIDFKQNVVLPPKEVNYRNIWGVNVKVNLMDEREIFAEKIRAASDRARYRDFYDLYLLDEKYKFNLNEIEQLLNLKEVRKDITHKSILFNWEIARAEKQSDMEIIYYAREISDMQMVRFLNSIKINDIFKNI